MPFTIACGNCWQCRHDNWSLCENSNPNDAAKGYDIFLNKEDNCEKVVLSAS